MAANTGAYNLIRSSVTTSTAITIQQVTVPAATGAEFTRCWVNQSTITTSAQTRIIFGVATVATLTSQTPALLLGAAQASKCVGGSTATGITATIEGGTPVVIVEEGFNIVNGWLYLPVPEERILLITRTAMLKFPSAPTSAGWISGQEWIEYAA